MPFADCVALYVVDSGLGNCLRRAAPAIEEPPAWAQHLLEGSEERLKGLVRLTVNFVESTLLANHLINTSMAHTADPMAGAIPWTPVLGGHPRSVL